MQIWRCTNYLVDGLTIFLQSNSCQSKEEPAQKTASLGRTVPIINIFSCCMCHTLLLTINCVLFVYIYIYRQITRKTCLGQQGVNEREGLKESRLICVCSATNNDKAGTFYSISVEAAHWQGHQCNYDKQGHCDDRSLQQVFVMCPSP
jgi:hypothetical protein